MINYYVQSQHNQMQGYQHSKFSKLHQYSTHHFQSRLPYPKYQVLRVYHSIFDCVSSNSNDVNHIEYIEIVFSVVAAEDAMWIDYYFHDAMSDKLWSLIWYVFQPWIVLNDCHFDLNDTSIVGVSNKTKF